MLKCECDGQAKWTILFLVGTTALITFTVNTGNEPEREV